jgi:hypothetical protein
MRLLFLDIDGVLNRFTQRHSHPDVIRVRMGIFNRLLITNINTLLRLTGAKVVISSAWRGSETYPVWKSLKEGGFIGDVIGETPELGHKSCRGDEIALYLKESMPDDFKDYVILDDCLDFLPDQNAHIVQTNTYDGLTEAKVVEIVNTFERLVLAA